MKTIIIYATKHGCTEKAVSILKSKLGGEISTVNMKKDSVPDLAQFDTVIIGGSIYMGNMQKEIKGFADANLPMLMKKKIGLFVCAGAPDLQARMKELEGSFPEELIKHAACKEAFGGEITYAKLGIIEKIIMRAVKGDKNDFSDLSEESIEAFAKAIS